MTGDRRWVVAVVAPASFANTPELRDRGGVAYRVSVEDGEISELTRGVATKYYNPGCGIDGRVALIRHEGRDQAETTVRVLEVQSGRQAAEYHAPGQVTSAVPVEGGVVAARDRGVVRLTPGRERVLARTAGLPFQLRATADGAQFLVDGEAAHLGIWSVGRRGAAELGQGISGTTRLFAGVGGRNVVVDPTALARPESLVVATSGGSGRALATSAEGATVVVAPDDPAGDEQVLVDGASGDDLGRPVPAVQEQEHTHTPDAPRHEGHHGHTTDDESVGDRRRPKHHSPGGPGCAIPRNAVNRQVHQPNSDQIDWAIQQADRNLLKASVLTRPANYLNTGVPTYQPSLDFVRGTLAGSPASTPIPPSVIQAVFAQESNWKQASWRALPGVAGNPLIGDYYGSAGTLDVIDLNNADCGYGVAQVTTPMRADSHLYSLNGKIKVAVDYAENVAAGIQFLVDAWNKLAAEGMTVNGGAPQYIENWYFAIWMYNTGYNEPDGLGNEGLGWTNNPMNADYPPDRTPFLRATYADAEHPNDWPYQERVLGWAETPQFNYEGDESYDPPVYQVGLSELSIPAPPTFCTSANDCDVNHLDGDLSYCTLANRHCWWHEPATFADCSVACATSQFTMSTTATEPAYDDNYPPNCNTLPPGSLSGAPTIVVDNQPSNLNVEGCTASGWASAGGFAVAYGTSGGVPLGEIDWHQLGTGFGGHTWFTKNRLTTDTAHVNVGTWTPPTLSGQYSILAHIPPSGASTPSAKYTIHHGGGATTDQVIDQHLHESRWVPLGTYQLNAGAKVTLSNVTGETAPGATNVAFDAIAFVPAASSATLVDVTVDAALIFDSAQTTTAGDDGVYVDVSNPNTDDEDVEAWMLDHTDPIQALPDCIDDIPYDDCVMPNTDVAIDDLAADVDTSIPAVWQGYANPDPPSTLSSGYFDDPSRHKHHNTVRIQYRLTSGGLIDPATAMVTLNSRSGVTHLPEFMDDLFNAVEADYGIPRPDLEYSVENLGTYSHASSPVDAYYEGLPGRAYRPVLDYFPISTSCLEVHAIGGGMIGWKHALNEGGIAGSIERWKDDIDDLVDNGFAPSSLYELADGLYHYWFSSQYATAPPPPIYEGSLFRKAPPIWIHQDFQVCGSGDVSPLGSDTLIARNSFMPDLYLWINGQRVEADGDPTPAGGPVATGNFLAFTRSPTHTYSAFGGCSFGSGATEDDNRHGNPWNIGAIFDGHDLGSNVYPCRTGFSVSEH